MFGHPRLSLNQCARSQNLPWQVSSISENSDLLEPLERDEVFDMEERGIHLVEARLLELKLTAEQKYLFEFVEFDRCCVFDTFC